MEKNDENQAAALDRGGGFSLDLELFLLGLVLAHDAFWLLDRVGGYRLDRMVDYWSAGVKNVGWSE